MNIQPISTIIITCNEEHNLRLSLPKITWSDEIIVVDSGSKDNTVALCQRYGCKIFHRKFDGYGKQKQFAVSLAKNDWVLCLDADEVLSDELVEEIKEEMKSPTANGYYIPMTFIFMGNKFKYGKESWRYFLRLFNKKDGDFDESKVHEKINVQGDLKKLKHNIWHYSYHSFSQYFSKFNKYTSYGAEMAFNKGKQKSVLAIVSAMPLYFLKYYFLEQNFLNGLNGFYWSVCNAFYHFVKYIKIRELHAKMGKIVEFPLNKINEYELDSKMERNNDNLS